MAWATLAAGAGSGLKDLAGTAFGLGTNRSSPMASIASKSFRVGLTGCAAFGRGERLVAEHSKSMPRQSEDQHKVTGNGFATKWKLTHTSGRTRFAHICHRAHGVQLRSNDEHINGYGGLQLC